MIYQSFPFQIIFPLRNKTNQFKSWLSVLCYLNTYMDKKTKQEISVKLFIERKTGGREGMGEAFHYSLEGDVVERFANNFDVKMIQQQNCRLFEELLGTSY